MATNSNVTIGINFKANTKEIEDSFKKLKTSLEDLQKVLSTDYKGPSSQLKEAKATAQQLSQIMDKAFNPALNTVNIATFKKELQSSGLTIEKIQSDLSSFGVQGDVAFNRLTTSVLTTNLQLKQTNSIIDSMGKTMVNTVKWGIASSVMKGFSQTVQGAFSYVQSLEKSLTNIRIVTGDSTDRMAEFAVEANRAAQALGKSTLDYTKTSLTFYQQGLEEADVQARTEATLKAQNITGAGSEMADYLTSVWNGYKVANEEAELYVDKLAAVADSSASNMSQLAIAMSKVASTANTLGVDVDQLNAQIATVVATTRQAPEAVGTAFKTIYSRMNDIKTGAEDAEITLGNYSGKMAQLGFNVLDATEHLRDTGDIMEEIGERWQTLTKEQQIYLAQTMGGQRQVNQLMALFDNWTKYSELLNTSLEAEGTLTEKNSRYMESLGAKMEQLGAAGERVKDALLDTDSLKDIVGVLTNITNLVGNLFETMGSGKNVILSLGSALVQMFSGSISKEINSIITNIQNTKSNLQTIKNEIEVTKMIQETGASKTVVDGMKEIQQYYSVLDQASINYYKNLIKEKAQLENRNIILKEQQKDVEEAIKKGNFSLKIDDIDWNDKDSFHNFNQALGNITDNWDIMSEHIKDGTTNVANFEDAFNNLVKQYDKFDVSKANDLRNAFTDFKITGDITTLRTKVKEVADQAQRFTDTINNSQSAINQNTHNIKLAGEATKQMAKNAKQAFDVNNAVKVAGAVGQITSSIITIKNLGSILTDKDVSSGEKIARVLTTAGYMIPTIVTSFKTLKTSGFEVLKNITLMLASQKAITLEKNKQLLLEAQRKGVLADNTSLIITQQALQKEQTALLLSSLKTMIPIAVAIGAAIFVAYKAYENYNKQANAAKKATEVANETKQAYDDLKTSLEDCKKALEDLRDAENNLDELTTGTQEWKDALQECNNKVLELISNYPELAKYVTNENGKLTLSQEGETEYLNQLEAGTRNARNASYIASSNSRQANLMADAANIAHRSQYVTEQELSSANAAGSIGNYPTSADVVKVAETINKLIASGEDISKTGIKGLSEKIVDLTKYSEEQVSAILANEDALNQLRVQLQQNEATNKLMYQSLAASNLQDNSIYKTLDDYGQQVASVIAGSALQERTENIAKKVSETISYNMNRFTSASNSEVQKILDRLNNAQKTNWRMDTNAVRANGYLAFRDESGNEKVLYKDQIAATIAASQALQGLGASAESASNILSNIDKNVADTANEAVKQFVAGQSMTATTRNGLSSLQGKSLEDIVGAEGLEAFAKSQGIDTATENWKEQVEKSWKDALNDLSSSFDNVAKEATKTVQDSWASIKNSEGIKNATLDFQQMIVADMRKAFAEDGKGALKNITDFYSKITNFDAFDEVVENFDFTKEGADGLGRALQKAGAATGLTTEELQAYIKAQKEAAEVASVEQNYKNVHDITDKLKKGDSIDAEQATILEQAGINTEAFFQRMADGTLKLKTNADLFQKYINQITLEPFKNKIDDLQNKINGINSFSESSYGQQDFEDFSNSAATTKQISTGVTVVDKVNQDKLDAQLKFLSLLDLEQQQEEQIADFKNRQNQLTVKDYQEIDRLLKEHEYDYNHLNEVQEQHQQNLAKTQEQLRNTMALPLDADVDESQWEDLTEHLQKYADQIPQVSTELKDNAEAAEDVAEAILRYDSAIGKVQKSYDDWLKALSSGSIEDQVQATEDLENVYSDLLDLPFDNVLSADFLQNVDNLNLLKQAANGSEQAYKELQEAAAQDILAQVGLDDSQFYIDKDAIEQSLYQLTGQEWDDIKIGASLDDEAFLNELTNMVNAAGMTAEQATDYLASMGVDAEVIEHDTTATENQTAIGYRPVETGPQTFTDTVSYFGPDGQIQTGQVHYAATGYSYEAIPIENQAEKQNKSFSLQVKSAKKASGGGFKYKNASAGNKGGGKKSGGGKGGGGGKSKQPTKTDPAKGTPDRYRNNTVKANKLANQMTKLQKQQDRLTGKKVTDNLKEQLKILEKQTEVIRERLGLEKDEQNELKNKLKAYGATFDADGTLNNYEKTYNAILKKYNDYVAKYNKMTADQQQSQKETLKNMKQQMDEAMKNLERYDKLQQEIAKTQQDLIDNAQAQIDNKVQQFEFKLTASLDLAQAKRDWNAFKRDVIDQIKDDDILGLNNYRMLDISSYLGNDATSIEYLTNQLKTLLSSYDGGGIFSGIVNDITGQTITDRQAWFEQLKKLYEEAKGELEDLKKLGDEIKDSIFDAIDAAQDAFDEQMDEYEFLGDLVNHNMKVIELTFGDEAYDRMAKYYDRIEENNNNQLDFLRQQKDLWYSRMHQEEARMNQIAATQGEDSNAYKEAESRFKEYEKHWMDSVKNLNSQLENAVQGIIDKYSNAINLIFKNFELSLGDGHKLQDIEDEWDLINDQADMFLDKINSAFELEKLQNAFEDAIKDNEGDIAAQQSLNDLMEQQLAYLRDKEKLTQYDVDRANALLQIEMKRLALEQARSNKNRLRLRRDSQGNYTYQYTADTEAINKAEEELAEARNSLYNSDKAAYVDNLSAVQKAAQQMEEKLKDVYEDANLSEEERAEKSYLIQKYYGEKINDLIAENASIRNNLMESSYEELAKMYNVSVDQLKALPKEQQDALFKDIIPQAGSYAAQLVETLSGEGGIGGYIEKLINSLNNAYAQRAQDIAEAEEAAHSNIEDIVNDTDKVIEQAAKLIDSNDELINSESGVITATQTYINAYNELMTKYIQELSSLQNQLEEVYRVQEQTLAGTVGSTRNEQHVSANENMALVDSIVNQISSAGDLGDKYVAYTPEWNGSTFAAMYGSSGVDEDLFNSDKETSSATLQSLEGQVTQAAQSLKTIYLGSNVKSVLDEINANTLNINSVLNTLTSDLISYHAAMLDKGEEIKEVIANQTIHIDAHFPSATQVQDIITAIENLPNMAAQYIGQH